MADLKLPPQTLPIVARARGILLKPKAEWAAIDSEPATIKGLFLGYAMILAAIPPLADMLGSLLFGRSVGLFGYGVTWRPDLFSALSSAIVTYVFSLIGVAVLALVIEFLAPHFGGEKNRLQAFKVAVYSMTAAWVAGVLGLFPPLAGLAALGGLYGLYLLWLGLPLLMRVPQDKTLVYLIVVLLAALVVNAVVMAVAGSAMAMGRPALVYGQNAPLSGTMNVPGYGSVDLNRAQAAQKAADAAIASALAASREGDARPQAAQVQPAPPGTLQELLPGTIAGYTRGEIGSSSTGAAGMNTAMARASYARGESRIQLSVTDMGGAAAFAQLGSAFDVNHTEQQGARYEKVGKVDGRLTTEKYDRAERSGQYSVIVAERFLVEADGTDVDMTALKAAVASVGYNRLETLARTGR
ncbi:MAG: YIP1 family protein [Caulobacteraceae bacterium]|nr:YIP1 family protein [Caulobacteraceae bacterium]